MKLYYMPGACSIAAHITLEWIGEPYEAQLVARDALKQPAYLDINPMGAVPALQDGDMTLTQNVAILEYLAERAPQLQLLGDDTPQSRAQVRRWLAFINADVHRTFSLIFGAARYTADEAAQAEIRTNAAAALRNMFTILNTQLDGKQYLTGDKPTIADPYLYVVLRWAHAKEIDLSGLDNLSTFFARMQSDKGVQSALKAEGL